MMTMNGLLVTPADLGALGLHNYGHFTSMRVENEMRVRGLALHMERLTRDSRKLFGAEIDVMRVRALAREMTEQVELPAVLRVTVFDAAGGIGHPGTASQPDILISARSAPPVTEVPPLRVESVHHHRDLAEVKHVGLFSSLYLRRAAQLRGFDDALFIDDQSRISEGVTWNIGFFDGTHLIWPKADTLAGVTCSLLRGVMGADGGMLSLDSDVHVSDVSETWTAFATNSSTGVRPIQSIDDVELLDNSPVIRNLQLQYSAIQGDFL